VRDRRGEDSGVTKCKANGPESRRPRPKPGPYWTWPRRMSAAIRQAATSRRAALRPSVAPSPSGLPCGGLPVLPPGRRAVSVRV